MKPKAATTAGGRRQISHKGWVLITLAAVITVALGAFLVKDIPSRMNYSATVNELEKIKKDVMEPAGAVQQPGEEKRGNGLLDDIFNCGTDVACPTVGGVWFVPLEQGKEAEFVEALTQRDGYTTDTTALNGCARLNEGGGCSGIGKKGDFDIGVSLEATTTARPAPSSDVSPKVWRIVSLRITL